MNRKIIPNIPEIGYYGNETDYAINVFNAVFNTAGNQIDRTEISVYSGMANRFCWLEDDWVNSRGCECLGSDNETPFEAEVRLLKAIGWAAKYITVHRDKDGSPLNTDNEQIRQDFVGRN